MNQKQNHNLGLSTMITERGSSGREQVVKFEMKNRHGVNRVPELTSRGASKTARLRSHVSLKI